jgi:hypothetical protein
LKTTFDSDHSLWNLSVIHHYLYNGENKGLHVLRIGQIVREGLSSLKLVSGRMIRSEIRIKYVCHYSVFSPGKASKKGGEVIPISNKY